MTRALLAGLAVVGLVAGGCAQPSATPGSTVTEHLAAPTITAAPRLRVTRAGLRLPIALAREAVIVSGHQVVLGGGLTSGDTSTDAAFRIGLGARRVTVLPRLATPVHDTAGAVVRGEPIVIGGGNSAEQSVVQAWDGSRWNAIGHLPQARSDLVAATVGGRVLVLGGYDGSRPAEPDLLASVDGRRWQVIGRLPEPVRYPASAIAGGSVWLFGGERNGVEQSAIQRIDPSTGRARVVGRLPLGLGHAAAVPLGDRILLAGGRTGTGGVSARMWWFDPGTRTVSPAGRLPSPLADAGVAVVDGTGYLLGGESPALTTGVLAVTYR